MISAWHITTVSLCDGRPLPAIGEWLTHDGPLAICESGLHGSVRLLDALSNIQPISVWLHAVTLDGAETQGEDDKLVARRRRIDASYRLDQRSLVRLSLESACLAWWLAGLGDAPDLDRALSCADDVDFDGAAIAACEAAWFVRTIVATGTTGAAWAAIAAREAVDATLRVAEAKASNFRIPGFAKIAREAAMNALEARAIELLTGGER